MTTKAKNMSDKALHILEGMTKKKLTLGNFLWSIRECDDMNQTEFAQLLGVSRQYLCDLENGRKIASARAAADFARLLGYSETQFVRLALQDEVNKIGMKYTVQLEAA